LNQEDCKEDEFEIELKVKKSAIRSVEGGIARINSKYLKDCEEELRMVVVATEKKNKVLKLVDDRLAPDGTIVLREGDMDDLKLEEGDMVRITPYKKLGAEIKGSWKKLKSRFKKDKEKGDE